MIKKLSALYEAAQHRPAGYAEDVLSRCDVDRAAGTYAISEEHWATMKAKYRKPGETINLTGEQKNKWFRKLWADLHARPKLFTSTAAELQWLDRFACAIGCGDCKKHWREWVKQNPPELSTPDAYYAWTVKAHNAVNARIGKPLWSPPPAPSSPSSD